MPWSDLSRHRSRLCFSRSALRPWGCASLGLGLAMQHTRSSHDPVLCRPSLKGWGITSSLLVICCEPCSMRSLIQAVPSTAQSHRWHHPDRRSWMAQTTGVAFQSQAVRDRGPREPNPRRSQSTSTEVPLSPYEIRWQTPCPPLALCEQEHIHKRDNATDSQVQGPNRERS